MVLFAAGEATMLLGYVDVECFVLGWARSGASSNGEGVGANLSCARRVVDSRATDLFADALT